LGWTGQEFKYSLYSYPYLNQQKPCSFLLYSLYNKIRNKGKIVSAGYGGGEREGVEWVVREGVGAEGRNEPSLVCTYE
jgi:hypothetical protein